MLNADQVCVISMRGFTVMIVVDALKRSSWCGMRNTEITDGYLDGCMDE